MKTLGPDTPPPKKSKRKDTVAEILLMKHLDEVGLTLGLSYWREFLFHPERPWRFDFIIRDRRFGLGIAIEIEGGIWTNGAHVRGKHFESDLRKYNEAAKLGWVVIRFTPNMIIRGESKVFLAELLR